MTRTRLEPSADHPITVERATETVTVSIDGAVVATTEHALVLREASYPPVYYVPRADVSPGVLAPTETTSYCPYKGDASYVGTASTPDVAWTYAAPYDAVAAIAGHLAFYPDKATVEVG